MPSMHISEFMDRFGPSNEGSDEVTGSWDYELTEQLKDPESNRTIVMLVEEFQTLGSVDARNLLKEPVRVDFNPDRVVDGHSRVIALKLVGADTVWYGTVV